MFKDVGLCCPSVGLFKDHVNGVVLQINSLGNLYFFIFLFVGEIQ